MKIGQIVTRPLVTIASNKTLFDAANLMVEKNIGLLVVSDQNDAASLVGVISERDIIRIVAASKPLNVPLRQASTKQTITVHEDAEVAEAAKAMNKNRIRHVVVVDVRGKPIGVVSMRDLVGERATLSAILQSHEKEIFHGAD
ncbi:MAG TPA: CBS domain-containing protein [Terriglobales bacterium]|nr:CBS domain-containing protein [Terriglobales bacterium]